MYSGQGLGNQLWCYVTTRLIAKNNGYRFGIKSPEKFKGIGFMHLDFGEQVFGGDGPEGGPPRILPETIQHYYAERAIIHPDGSDIRMRDHALMNVPDNTKIDGCMQDVAYIEAHRKIVREWLQVKPEYDCYDYSSDEICIINFRGSGYVRDKNFFLPKSYWLHAMNHMRKKNPRFRFVVITEDVATAQKFFPDLEVFHFDIAKDYAIIKNAHYLILSNSSFAQFPALLSTKLKFCIAPKYWGRHNISDGYWSLGYNITKGWHYQDREGNLHDYDACIEERDQYMEKHASEFFLKQQFDPRGNYVVTLPPGTVTPFFAKRLFRKVARLKVRLYRLLQETSPLNAFREFTNSLAKELSYIAWRKIKDALGRKPEDLESSSEERRIFGILKDKLHTVFDVGARDELYYYQIKKDCSYHLFEPNKRFAARLRDKMAKLPSHHITLNEYGLADVSADDCIYYEKSQSFEINPHLVEDTESGDRYSVRTLDQYVKEYQIKHIDFLKVDAEGFDYKIFKGGLTTIRANKVSFIQFEYWTGIQRFKDLLGDTFDFYLIVEPVLLRAIEKHVLPLMSVNQAQINYRQSIIPLDQHMIDLIDKKLSPLGLGGNVLGINKHIQGLYDQKLIFEVDPNPTLPETSSLRIVRRIKDEVVHTTKYLWRISGAGWSAGVLHDLWATRAWRSRKEIAQYRKTIKIYDVFTFFNELDLLEIRLNILDPYVDHFVIVEATETFSGNKKPLYFKENRERFKQWDHKIIHYVVDDTPKDADDLRKRLHDTSQNDLDRQITVDTLTSSNVGKDIVHWLKEFYQKESVKKALVGLRDTDICYISDLDEIWNPDLVIDYTQDSVFKPLQTSYVYYLNNRSDENWRGWTGTIATQYKNIKNSCLNHLRTHKKMMTRYVFLRNGGWHFTFQGGFDGALRKLRESNHPFYDPKKTIPTLAERIAKNKDFRGRNLRFRIDERGLPKYLLHNKDRYKKFFK